MPEGYNVQINPDGSNSIDILTEAEAVAIIEGALTEAKASGEFDGAKGDKGDKGDPYTLTDTDKTSIANAVKSSLPKLTMVGTDASGVEHTWTIYGS
jgi:hypothetical protein